MVGCHSAKNFLVTIGYYGLLTVTIGDWGLPERVVNVGVELPGVEMVMS